MTKRVSRWLLPNHKDRKRIGQHRFAGGPASSSSLWGRGAGGWRGRWWYRAIFRRHGQDVIGLRIQGQRLGTHHRLEILFHRKTGGAAFLDDRHGTVAVRTERF